MPSALDIYQFFLEAADLKGRSHQLEVAEVKEQQIWDPRLKRNMPALVVTFTKARKVLKLNKTQCAAMIEIAGRDDYSTWVGLQVMLTPSEIANNKTTITITPAPPSTTTDHK